MGSMQTYWVIKRADGQYLSPYGNKFVRDRDEARQFTSAGEARKALGEKVVRVTPKAKKRYGIILESVVHPPLYWTPTGHWTLDPDLAWEHNNEEIALDKLAELDDQYAAYADVVELP